MTSPTEQMTERLRWGNGRAHESLREALAELDVDPATSALVDFCPESAPMEEVGPVSCKFDWWHEVPTRVTANRDELVRGLNENRRAKRPWNEGIPSWVCRPQDILYNGLIQEGRDFLKRENC